MLIRSISVEGFTCFAERLTLEGLSDTVNVLYGPNGIGKSSVFRALHFALFRRYNASGALINSILPWNRQLTPSVALQFEHSGHEYRLTKRFVQSRGVRIERREGGRWTSFAEADLAERFLEGMTGADSGRAGARELGNFSEVLWTTQGNLQLPPLGENVVAAIQQSVGEHVSASVKNLKGKVEEDYKRVFTDKTGKLKTGRNECLQLQIQQECERLEAVVKEADVLVCAYESAAAIITTLQECVTADEAQRGEFEQQVQHLRLQRERYRDVKSAFDKAAAERSLAEAKLRRTSECIETIRKCRQEKADLQARADKLSADRKTQQLTLERAQEQLAKAQSRQSECEGVQEAARKMAEDAAAAERYLSAIQERQELKTRRTQIDEAKAELSKIRERLAEMAAPSHSELAELRKHQAEAVRLKDNLDKSRISLTFVAERATCITVHAGEAPGSHAVDAGGTVTLAGTPHLSFSVPTLGRFDLSGPVTDYDKIAKAYDVELAWLRQSAKRFGTDDLPQLEAKRREADELKTRGNSTETLIRTLLTSNSEAAMSSRLDKLEKSVIDALEQQYPAWAAHSPDAASLRSAAKMQGETAKAQWEQSRNAVAAATQAYQAAVRAHDKTENDIRSTNAGIESASQRLSEALRDGLPDEQREDERLRAAAAVINYGEQVKRLEKELSAFPKNLEEELASRERILKDLIERLGENHDSLIAEKAQQSALIRENPYTKLSTAKEGLSVAQQRLTEEKSRNDATALLYETFNQVVEESLSAVAEPVAAQASQYLEFVCGKPLARIRLGSSFQSVGVIPNGCAEEDKKVDCMSGGEREQIYLCTRLALAKELARQERQLVILDDVLTVTDADRMARICELLERSAQHLQIVLLTCQPERFRPLRNANFIDLLEIIKREQKTEEVA